MKNFEIVSERGNIDVNSAKLLLNVYKTPYMLYNDSMKKLVELGLIEVSFDKVVTTVEGDTIIESASEVKTGTVSEFSDFLLAELVNSGFVMKESVENNTSIMTKSLGTKLFAVDVNKKGNFRMFVDEGHDLKDLKQLAYSYKLSRDRLRCYLTFSCNFDKIKEAVKLLKEIV